MTIESDLRKQRQQLWLEAERLVDAHGGLESRKASWSRRDRQALDVLLDQIDRLDKNIDVATRTKCHRCRRLMADHEGPELTCPTPPPTVAPTRAEATKQCSYCRWPADVGNRRCVNCGAPLY